jgi:hypothetical protein
VEPYVKQESIDGEPWEDASEKTSSDGKRVKDEGEDVQGESEPVVGSKEWQENYAGCKPS